MRYEPPAHQTANFDQIHAEINATINELITTYRSVRAENTSSREVDIAGLASYLLESPNTREHFVEALTVAVVRLVESSAVQHSAVRVYVAGPYASDPERNTRVAVAAGDAVLDLGYAPMVPHLAHYWHTLHQARPYEDWMRLDLAWSAAADVVLRLPGESPGADREVEHARALGIPVVHSVDELAAWAGDRP
jgi:hypothetical protein